IAAPLASASSLSQFDRQLRQKPARFIRSIFCTSVRERRCSTRRRKAAASSSVLVLSSIVMAIISLFPAGYRDQVGIVTDFAISQRKQAPTKRDFVGHCLKI